MILQANTAAPWPLADQSVQCIVTSPPYWGLRDYGVAGQLGSEATPDLFVASMVQVFREARRVLRDDGTLWLNLGDSYVSTTTSSVGSKMALGGGRKNQMAGLHRPDKTGFGLDEKNLIGIPWRVAFALQADGAASPAHMRDTARMIEAITASYESRDEWPERIRAEVERLEREYRDAQKGGWYLRSDIVWAKSNPMPESVRDRPTRSYEYIFLLTKKPRYYYDAEAVREPAKQWGGRAATFDRSGNDVADHVIPGQAKAQHRPRTDKQRGHSRRHAGFNDRWHAMEKEEQMANGRNRRDVWTIPARPALDGEGVSHFAAFPPDLVKPCILAGCPAGGIVLDPFAGTGTTVYTAERLGRRGVGLELNPEYARLARKNCMRDDVRQGVLEGVA
jgi:DNA modification methylase